MITLHLPIPYELHLWLVWDRLQVGMQDGRFLFPGLIVPVTIGDGLGIESLVFRQRLSVSRWMIHT